MRVASMHRITGPAGSDTLAASGGLDVPGREPHEPDVPAVKPTPELIPGERDPTNLTHREPGAVSARFDGSDTPPPDRAASMDEKTAREHAREGGKKNKP